MHAPGPDEPMPGGTAATRPEITAAQGSIVVKAPITDVYQRWLSFEDYPKFITSIKRVRKMDESHFFASIAFNGEEYDAMLEIMLRVPERRLAWRTVSSQRAPDHLGAGVVSFAARPEDSTHVTLKMTSTFGGGLSARVDTYLQEFKSLAEARIEHGDHVRPNSYS